MEIYRSIVSNTLSENQKFVTKTYTVSLNPNIVKTSLENCKLSKESLLNSSGPTFLRLHHSVPSNIFKVLVTTC